jgi:opacity protein-like surface antigen
VCRACAAAAAAAARRGRWRGRQAGRQATSGWTEREWFCHSIRIITGVTLFYVGGGFIAGVLPVTAVSVLLRPHAVS